MSTNVGSVSSEVLISNTNINVRKVEFIDGFRLEELKKNAFKNLVKDPLVGYGSILHNIESRIYSSQPESLMRSNIKKYMKEENLYLVELNDTYCFRPDLVSQIFYGTNEYFHLVLLTNSMKSFLEFIPSTYNNLIFVLKPSIITSI